MACNELSDDYKRLQEEHTQLLGAHKQLRARYDAMRTVATIHNHHREALEMTVDAQVCLAQPAFCDTLITRAGLPKPNDEGEKKIDAAVNSLRLERLRAKNVDHTPAESLTRVYGDRLAQLRQELSADLGAPKVNARMSEYEHRARTEAGVLYRGADAEMHKARLQMRTRKPGPLETLEPSDPAYHTTVEMHADAIAMDGTLRL